MTRHILSLGAGVNSTALLHVVLDEGLPLDEVVFADTGAEKPETYAYLKDWILPFLDGRGIPYARVAAKYKGAEDTLEARCLRGRTVPDRHYRWSTRDFKIRPIYRYLGIPGPRTRTPPAETWTMYLGIAFDEIERVKDPQEPWVRRQWPLVDRRITRQGCVQIIAAKGWPVPPKSGCWFCPFAALAEWRWLYKEHPELWRRARTIEENGRKFPNFVIRQGTTLRELELRFEDEAKQRTLPQFEDPQTADECEGVCFT